MPIARPIKNDFAVPLPLEIIPRAARSDAAHAYQARARLLPQEHRWQHSGSSGMLFQVRVSLEMALNDQKRITDASIEVWHLFHAPNLTSKQAKSPDDR